jgi:hypothetical protein
MSPPKERGALDGPATCALISPWGHSDAGQVSEPQDHTKLKHVSDRRDFYKCPLFSPRLVGGSHADQLDHIAERNPASSQRQQVRAAASADTVLQGLTLDLIFCLQEWLSLVNHGVVLPSTLKKRCPVSLWEGDHFHLPGRWGCHKQKISHGPLKHQWHW